MPQSRPTLKPARRRYRMAEIDLKAAGAAQTAPYRTDVMSYEADGLGASLFRLPPQVESLAALPLAGAGLYALVIDGEVGFGGQRLLANSALYVGPGQTLGRIVAGPHGATFLMVQFPPDLT
jgi:redox-sensitive bicupin YhaK (pirin superfamily)